MAFCWDYPDLLHPDKTPIAMTARDITIWTTFILLLLTLIVPAYFFYSDFPTPEYYGTYPPGEFVVMALITAPIMWFITSWPILICYCIAKRLKYEVSCGILLIATIGYASFYAYGAITAITTGSSYFGGLALFVLTLISTPAMLPIWIIVLVMNPFYIDQATNSEAATQEDLPPIFSWRLQ